MKVIHKHRLSAVGGNTDSIRIHAGAKLLHIDVQRRGDRDVPFAWFEVDDEAPLTWIYVRSIHTGVAVPSECEYLGTVLMHGGSHVTHYYLDVSA